MSEGDGSELEPSRVKRPSWWTDGKPVVRRFDTFERLDGVCIAVELDGDGRPVFVALFPDAPIGRRIVLEGKGLDDAWLEIDRRWPPSPWMVEQAGPDDLDLIENGVGFRWTFHAASARVVGDGEQESWPTSSLASPTMFDSALKLGGRLSDRSRAPKHWLIFTDAIPYEDFRIAALELQIEGRGSVSVDSVKIGGGANLLREGGRIFLGVGGAKQMEYIRDLRHFPKVNISNNMSADIVVDGDARVSVSAIMKTLLPAAARTIPFGDDVETSGGFVRSGGSYG